MLMKRCNHHYENVHLLQSSVLKASSYFQCSINCINCINLALDDWSTNLFIIILVSCA